LKSCSGFCARLRIDRVGCFTYSEVEGAHANLLPGAVPQRIKEERRARLMAAQEEISRLKLERKIGKTLEVLVDESHGSHAIARSSADAPEIDGIVRVQGNGLRWESSRVCSLPAATRTICTRESPRNRRHSRTLLARFRERRNSVTPSFSVPLRL
jgi:hypothetical protein